jgi:hypothetical protein
LTNPFILPIVRSGASLTLIFALNEGLNGGLFKQGIVCYASPIRR